MKPRTPESTRIYAVGDIHGCNDLLNGLLEKIIRDDRSRPAVKTRKIVFLGDYVDRGPGSAQAVDILLSDLPKGFEAVFLKGNHEEMMMEALNDRRAVSFWLGNGGRETLTSYGVDLSDGEGLERDSHDLMQEFRTRLPREHRDFLASLSYSHQCGDYFFVHAGIHPDHPLDAQKDRDLIWIRDRFLFSEKDFGKIIVHGHTPVREVDRADNRIGIDTAAVYGGWLTAIVLDGTHQEFLQISARDGE